MNSSGLPDFLLARFTESHALLRLQALLLTLLYLVAALENAAVALLTLLDRRLRTPMYFFLRHLALLDLGLISTTIPKAAVNALTLSDSISFLGCAFQLFLVILLDGCEVGLLTAMSYDRYVAICRPLHYEVLMSRGTCLRLLAGSWLGGGAVGVLYSAGTFSLSFCGSRTVHQFFCDVPALLKLTCARERTAISVGVAVGVCYGFSCFLCILISYARIFAAVLQVPAGQKRARAYSTCLPHLAVVVAFFLTGSAAYLKPVSDQPSLLDLLLSMFYSVVPPTLNPVIYCLRNKDIQAALGRVVWHAQGCARWRSL
ncbi:olfactory receptor 14K1-like [Talpa occidentalis]|uniref:olfactory receptor 14K1-like n=1 Tax=Talpa occidentalis TaxID=50954 RepID=UPI0018900B65|nr:olfactory receptor 14K1-like [Talpa occidentalis]